MMNIPEILNSVLGFSLGSLFWLLALQLGCPAVYDAWSMAKYDALATHTSQFILLVQNPLFMETTRFLLDVIHQDLFFDTLQPDE